MKVRAKHWLNFDGTWHRCGEVFDLPAAEAERLRGSVEWLEAKPAATLFDAAETADSVSAAEPEAVQEEPKKRRRTSKKTAE